MSSVLVVGGGGYVGSATCKELAREGLVPVALDDYSSSTRQRTFGPVIEEDFQRFDPRGIDDLAGVIFLAASTSVVASVVDPLETYAVNVFRTFQALAVLETIRPLPVVFASSAAIYGGRGGRSYERDAVASHPLSPYGRSKRMGEEILADMHKAYGTRYACLRYFNVAGASEDRDVGEMHRCETHLVPRLLAATTEEPFQLTGTSHPTADGTAVRDYVHVADVARANVLALRWLLDGGAPRTWNVGSGRGTSVREVVRHVEVARGESFRILQRPARPGDPPELVADVDLIRRDLQWAPRYDVPAMVRTALSFHAERGFCA